MRARPSVEYATRLDDLLAEPDHWQALRPIMGGWARTVRDVTGLPITSLARRMKVSKQAISKLEQHEAAGSISLTKLAAMAEALDCDFVYGFLPREPFGRTAERRQRQQDKARKSKRRIPTAL